MNDIEFRTIVEMACLAPSVHNTQPARWKSDGQAIEIYCDTSICLAIGDPGLRDAGLSCGAAVEATVLALSEHGIGCTVVDLWHTAGDPLRPVARLTPGGTVMPDRLAPQVSRRFTHRGAFRAAQSPLDGWTRTDAALVTDRPRIEKIAALNDTISLNALRDAPFRRELVHWMRLSRRHPRHGVDGMAREAMRMSAPVALGAGLALGPLWAICDRIGLTRGMVAEAAQTVTAPVIACFHRPLDESPVTSGRAYLRLWLEATARGMAGWPMAALADDPSANAQMCTLAGIETDRRLIQVIQFGVADAGMPPRARRPLDAVIL